MNCAEVKNFIKSFNGTLQEFMCWYEGSESTEECVGILSKDTASDISDSFDEIPTDYVLEILDKYWNRKIKVFINQTIYYDDREYGNINITVRFDGDVIERFYFKLNIHYT